MKKTFKTVLRRSVFLVLLVVVFGVLLLLGVNFHMYRQTRGRVVSADEAVSFAPDCILVLGAGVREDGSPSHMLEDRLLTGVALYRSGASDRILMSGDHGRENYDEVNCMKSFAMEKGVPSEDIFMDHAGFSTYESLYRAKEVFGAKKIVIVTQKYHLYRALYIADRLGLEAVGVAADYRGYTNQFFREVREILARNKDVLTTTFGTKPTYLGEKIPIDGDGDLSND